MKPCPEGGTAERNRHRRRHTHTISSVRRGTTRFVPRLIGKTGQMRRRALLLALFVGGLAAVGTVGLAGGVTAGTARPSSHPALARAELADAPAPTAFSRARDALARDHRDRLNTSAALAAALVLTLAGGWWLARERAARVRGSRLVATRRTRAPPRQPAIVHC